jgi:cytochrome c oxidase assembly protein subunit 15
MSRSTSNPWLHRFAVFTAICTLLLIGLGGLVTSHEAGMAVPDWPTTNGYNMFLFPVSKWIGGIFYEHTHRLLASFVGFLTTILAVWIWLKDSRRFLRWLGVAAFFAVALQGVLGGLRVVLFKDQIGIFHATLAQIFLVLVSAIALFTSEWWQSLTTFEGKLFPSRGLRRFATTTTILIFAQLILGATMRHQHAGLAVPDFPLAYGKIWPPTDTASVEAINQNRSEIIALKPISSFHIVVHMFHRLTAFLILGCVSFLAFKLRRTLGAKARLTRLSLIWFGMICTQLILGIVTVLKNKPADIATAHVILGAGSLVMGAMICLVSKKISVEGENQMRHSSPASLVQPVCDPKAALTAKK